MLPPGTRGLGRIPANHDGEGRKHQREPGKGRQVWPRGACQMYEKQDLRANHFLVVHAAPSFLFSKGSAYLLIHQFGNLKPPYSKVRCLSAY